ncbi:3-isopropylmalate dehydratase small subunit [Segeticoccus rhizosphaerae]|uniref:3-isopropylmalate dehydratase small subunit n=1 Tax=Segeticoccus rhizosphaerae TaxID=1104777 RepID=UPI0010C01078|nr:3-isopropylmalate dehydratase small subunit [Ornithinicoccus soli]
MEPFTVHVGRAVPLRRTNVDTDQILPVRFLTRSSIAGYGENLFNDWRDDPDFVLNDPRFTDASILVAGTDFGIGSSRESAVWALTGRGFKAVLSPRFGDIFYGNALSNGLLPVTVDEAATKALWELIERDPSLAVTIDLGAKQVRAASLAVPFEIDSHARWRLMHGLDDVSLTEHHTARIADYESRRRPTMPTTGRRREVS